MLENYEQFTDQELAYLRQFVTNTDSSVFAMKNLPEVIKGALFSRYSRSKLGLRTLLLKEFIHNQEGSSFQEIASLGNFEEEKQALAIQRAQDFYDRILDGYGDDSIGELGGAHLAIENISMLAAKAIQDCRIGGSPLEKSTRYIPFDQKVQGSYLYYKEPVLLASAHRDLYLSTCDQLFSIYSSLIPELTHIMQERFPKDAHTPPGAYKASLRAKVLDALRGILPASTLTNMGVFGNGRFFEGLLHKLQGHALGELQEIGKSSYQELAKVIPSFVRRAQSQHKTHLSYQCYADSLEQKIEKLTSLYAPEQDVVTQGVELIETTPHCLQELVTALLYETAQAPYQVIRERVEKLEQEELEAIIATVASPRNMRRHKSPRALEHVSFLFEITADFGSFRDLHRHRILTQQRQPLSTHYGYYMPQEIEGTPLASQYADAMALGKQAYDLISQELPHEAQYVVPMAYNIRWYFHINLRSLQWLVELRSGAAGHPSYRKVAQDMARLVCEKHPGLEPLLHFVDYQGHDLGRMHQETHRTMRSSG